MTINKFDGKFSFLSNFSASRIETRYGVFQTAEHLYQAAKTLDRNDKEKIRLAHSPGRAKRLGRYVTLRSDWEEIKTDVMLGILQFKFYQNPDLAEKLLQTKGHKLIEGNTWHDNEWGNCLCDSCKLIPGKNLLGKTLMKIREELQETNK